jgi:hypothetical protein
MTAPFQGREVSLNRGFSSLVCAGLLIAGAVLAQAPIKLTIDTASRELAIPNDFVGLGFETKSVAPNTHGVSGYFFTPTNTQLITLFQNIGIRNIRVGGGTVDGSSGNERCVMPVPTHGDIDNLFKFAQAAGVKVIYSVRLTNLDTCPNPNLAEDDARIAHYVWTNYRSTLDSFSIGNEPDVRSFHTYPGHPVDPLIYEATVGVPGSAYASYFTDWRHFADVIREAVPEAKLSGPDTAVSDTGTFVPDRSSGVSWTLQFANDLEGSGILKEALQHHYVWGGPGNTTAIEAIDDMLSRAWDDNASIGRQPAMNGGTAEYHPYPFVYSRVLAPLVAHGVPYRMTEANDCLHGVFGASDGYAAALWALDYMHWWAAHHMAGVNFHNNPWLPTDTIVPSPNPCPTTGCEDYHTAPKGYGMKAFDLGGHGYVEPVTMSNPNGINVTSYAVGDAQNLYVTIINRTHSTTNDSTDAAVTIEPKGFAAASCASMILTDGDPGNALSYNVTLGGATIANNARWSGRWTPLVPGKNGGCTLTVPSTSAAVVKLHAAGNYVGPVQVNQDGALEIFGIGANGEPWRNSEVAADGSHGPLVNWNGWVDEKGVIQSKGSLAVVKNLDNTLEVFIPSATGGVSYSYQLTPGGAWSNWTDMGSSSAGISDLQVANNADGSLIVFGIGANGDVWYASQSAPGVGWSSWMDLSGEQIQPGFVIGQNLNGQLEIFGAAPNGNAWNNSQAPNGEWTGWNRASGQSLNSHFTIARNLDGRLEIFGVDSNSHVWHNWQTSPGGGWNGWSEIPGKRLRPGFVVGQNKDGRLILFGVSTRTQNARTGAGIADQNQQRVWSVGQQTPGGSFSKSWIDMGGANIDPRLVVSNTADGRIQLFGTGSNHDVWSDRQRMGSGDRWEGWTDFRGKGVQLYALQLVGN